MVEFKNVSKVYQDGTRAIDNLSLKINRGEFIVFIGPSGCGKTTTLKMVNYLEKASSGEVLVNNSNVKDVHPVHLRRGIGYVIQEIGLLPHLTIAENIAIVPNLLKWPEKKIRMRVDELLDLSGLSPEKYRNRLPSQLSGGQQQRIGVLRALAADPDVVLMDEPFGALDPISKDKLQRELLDLQEKVKKTIIFVTHDIDEAFKLADRIVLMRRGKIEQIGTPDDLKLNPVNDFVRNFIGEERFSAISPDSSVENFTDEAPAVISIKDNPEDVLEKLEELNSETAQIVDSQGRWKGMVYLADLLAAERKGEKTVSGLGRSDRKLYMSEATIRDAAEILTDMDFPIPVLDDEKKLMGIITNGSIARLMIDRFTRTPGGKNE